LATAPLVDLSCCATYKLCLTYSNSPFCVKSRGDKIRDKPHGSGYRIADPISDLEIGIVRDMGETLV